ncbi:Glucosaminyl phosphatidylinositol (GlcN-PI) nositol acylation protein [Marasmius tenuissimus]|nr:Glucosaminyl phosphatidylinositol (GlcN-PI) nositol acylation protein [Marasmius tenuissimus]
MDDYKTRKIESVSGLAGSSVVYINIVSSTALSSIALYYALRTRFPSSPTRGFTTSWLLLIFPLLLSMTVFANQPGILFLSFAAPAAALVYLKPRKERGVPLPSTLTSPISPREPSTPEFSSPRTWTCPVSPQEPPTLEFPRPKVTVPQLNCVTTYRAHMLMMTILAILAVDFPIFPRSLAKCETFGVSLMDLGVGSFVFTQGLVSALPLIKDPGHLLLPLAPKVKNIVRKMIPVILLGLVRVVLVKGTDYPEHETEYGVHWNFFLTLAVLPILQVLLHPFMAYCSITTLGMAVMFLHQIALSKYGLEDYVFTAPRISLISANKEGLVSLTGYLAVHLFGLTTGVLILPPTPSYFRRIRRQLGKLRTEDDDIKKLTAPRQTDKTLAELGSYASVWWMYFGLVRVLGLDGGKGPSRRLVNVSYVFWVCAYNTSFILGYMLLDMVFFPTPLPRKPKYKDKDKVDAKDGVDYTDSSSLDEVPPAIFAAINKNGLALFLLSNVATGLVNLTVRTLDTSDFWAMVILSGYGLGICLVAWVFRNKRLLNL